VNRRKNDEGDDVDREKSLGNAVEVYVTSDSVGRKVNVEIGVFPGPDDNDPLDICHACEQQAALRSLGVEEPA